MTVQELIDILLLCNPNLPVFMEADYCTGLAVGTAEFRYFKETDDPETVELGWSYDRSCVLIVNEETVFDPCEDCGKQCENPDAGVCRKCLAKKSTVADAVPNLA